MPEDTRLYFDENDEPMACNDCGKPIYYDYSDDQYYHAWDPERGCFLIPVEEAPSP